MNASPLRSMVEHDVRLDMLDCLDRERRTIPEVSERIGRNEKHVAHHMRMLVAFDLVEATGDEGEDGQPLYSARLKYHPIWVTRAVNVRRRARKNRK